MGSDYKKEGILRIVLLLGLALILIPLFSSAQSSGCCIYQSGACYASSSTQCSGTGSTFLTNACSLVPNCTQVCCEPGDGDWLMMFKEQCARSNGIEHPGLGSNSCFGCASTETPVFGKAHYQDGSPAASAIVNILNSTSSEKIINANAEGSFSTCVPKNKAYTLTITNPANVNCVFTSPTSFNPGNNPYDAGEITLPCLSTGGQCLTNWIIDWDDDVMQCGHRTVINGGNCVPPSDNKPADFVPCITDGSLCGNGLINSGEQCDPNNNAIPGGNKCSSGSVGTVSCSSNCIIQRNCFSCSEPFSNELMCECPNHATNPLCLNGCTSSTSISSFTASAVYDGTKGIRLNWEIPGECIHPSVTISRCNANTAGTGCAAPPLPKIFNAGSSNLYLDTDFDNPNVKTYCYNITATGSDGANNYVLKSNLVCASLFDDECLEHQDEAYCVGKDLFVCSGGRLSSTDSCDCGCRDAILLPEPSPAQCVGSAEYCDLCDVCSGPFGLFSYPSNKGVYYSLTGLGNYAPGYSTCEEAMIFQGGYCYSNDYSRNKAIIGQFHSCFDVSSCYDYRAKTSCEENACQLSALTNCKWVSLLENDELGLGICIPEEENEQDCKKCNELNILGNYCSPELCSLFGTDNEGNSNCYYNANKIYANLRIDNSSCMNIRDVACETYDTEYECIGSPGNNFRVNVQYNGVDANSIRVNGNNNYIQKSNDLFKKGKCTWNPTELKCIKDSDSKNQPPYDCSISPGKKNEDCLLDFTNPETTLIIFGEEMNNNERFSTSELATMSFTTSEKVSQTFVSFSSTAFVYPNISYSAKSGIIRTNFINKIMALTPGNYNVYFYSEDLSKNLEFIKSHSFTVIPNLSGIKITSRNNSWYDFSIDSYLTNLTITVDYDDAETLDCKATLRNEENPGRAISGDGYKVSPYLQWDYSYLPDGVYILNISCSDSHLQRYTPLPMTFYIEADISMKNPSPRGGTFRAGSVTIGIDSNESSVCYYNDMGGLTPNPSATTLGSPWELYSTANGISHTATVTESSTGMKYYYSACFYPNNPAGEKWFVGNSGDIIYFAIDESAPNILVYDDADREYTNTNAEPTENLYLKIVCDDSDSGLMAGKDYSFGCESISTTLYYEAYQNKPNVIVPPQQIATFSGTIGELQITAPESYVKTYLDITVRDKGGNTDTRKILLSNLRNLNYTPPDVLICNPETGMCT